MLGAVGRQKSHDQLWVFNVQNYKTDTGKKLYGWKEISKGEPRLKKKSAQGRIDLEERGSPSPGWGSDFVGGLWPLGRGEVCRARDGSVVSEQQDMIPQVQESRGWWAGAGELGTAVSGVSCGPSDGDATHPTAQARLPLPVSRLL